MEFRNYTAKTVDEAITQACLEIGVTSDCLEYEVVQMPSSGFLGIGSKPAVIKARRKEEEKMPEPVKPARQDKSVKTEKAGRSEKAEKSEKLESKEKAVKSPKAEKAAAEEKKDSLNAAAATKDSGSERKVLSADEIERRANEAAARAQAEGRTEEQRSDYHEERRGRNDRYERSRSDRGRSRYDRNDRGRREDRRPRRDEFTEVHHEPSKPKPERVIRERSDEEAQALTSAAETFLKDVFRAMNIQTEMTTSYDAAEGAVNCTFAGEEMGLLIGKRGQTLDSLQYLTSLVINKNTDEYVRVKLDTEDYRSRRADTLNNLARNIAFKVRKTRRPVVLEPMNPYERRIIHSALQGNKFVETYSEGEEPYRHVVVAPKR